MLPVIEVRRHSAHAPWTYEALVRYQRRLAADPPGRRGRVSSGESTVSPRVLVVALGVLLALMFSKFFYLARISSYYTFYLIHKFGVSIEASQIYPVFRELFKKEGVDA